MEEHLDQLQPVLEHYFDQVERHLLWAKRAALMESMSSQRKSVQDVLQEHYCSETFEASKKSEALTPEAESQLFLPFVSVPTLAYAELFDPNQVKSTTHANVKKTRARLG